MAKQKTGKTGSRLRYGAVSTILLIAALAVLLGANILAQRLEKRNAWKVDLSFNAATTYGEITAEALAALDKDVHAYMFLKDEVFAELLDRCAAATPRFTWERADLTLSPGLQARFSSELTEDSASSDSVVFYCEETDRWRAVTSDQLVSVSYGEDGESQVSGLRYENAVTSAIRYVSAETAPRILVLQGHGETTQTEMVYLTELWNRSAYDVYGYSLNTTQTTLEPTDLLAILSPTSDLTDDEYQRIQTFANQGGCLLFSVDPQTPLDQMPNLTALMRMYGFIPLDGMVCAGETDPDSFYQNRRSWLFPSMQPSSATNTMIQNGNTTTLMISSRGFEDPQDMSASYIYTDTVLSANGSARLIPLERANSDSPDVEEDDRSGPFALALLSSRITEDGYASRAFVIGSTGTLTDDPDLELDLWAGIDTEELILRVTGYLFGGASLDAGIVARAAVRPSLSVNSHRAGTLAVFILPTLVLAAGVVALAVRKRR